jgi:hypothetical protein
VCGRARAASLHHRRKPGRLWCPCNLLHVCGELGTVGCHGHIEANPYAAKQQGWWVEPWCDPHRIPVWVARWGYVLLDAAGDLDLISSRR